MKKSGVFLAAVAVCMILLTGTAFAAVEFKFAHSGSLEHQYQIGAEQFKKLVEEKSGEGYYAVQVALDPDDVRKSHVDLQAGMPAEVIVPTRPRTLIEYLISPLRDEIAGAFRER